MYIEYRDDRLKKILNDRNKLTREFGPGNARKIVQRLNEIAAASSLGMLLQCRIGRCHPLKGVYAGMYAMDLEGGWRLVFRPVLDEGQSLVDANLLTVEIVRIMEVTDYHG